MPELQVPRRRHDVVRLPRPPIHLRARGVSSRHERRRECGPRRDGPRAAMLRAMRSITLAWTLAAACSPAEPSLVIDAGTRDPLDSCDLLLPPCALVGPCTSGAACCSRTCLPSGVCEAATAQCGGPIKCADRDVTSGAPCCSRACVRGHCVTPAHGFSDECGGFDVCGTAGFPHRPDCEPCIAAVCEIAPSCCSWWALECSCWLRRVCPDRCPR